MDDLAIFGGSPAFETRLHVGRPNIPNRRHLMQRINDLLDNKWLTNDGPFVQELEQRVANRIGVSHCIATCNGTLALEIAIRALELSGEVIVPSMTFVATAHSLQRQGITPRFCDIDPHTYNLDPTTVEQMITPRTSGILGVHLFGRPCNTKALAEIARREDLALLFDAAHAFACSHDGRMIGSFGDAEVFSFHATKIFNTFEGGAIVTDSDKIAKDARLMRNFGFEGYDKVVCLGTNAKMNEISAAMGLTQLESIDDLIAVNQENYLRYRTDLADLRGLGTIEYDRSEKCNYQYVVLEIDDEVAQINRDDLMQVLGAEIVLARRYFFPGCHRMEPYRSLYPKAGSNLTATEEVARRLLQLPTGTAIGEDEIGRICRIIRLVLAEGIRVTDQLRRLDLPPTGKVRESVM